MSTFEMIIERDTRRRVALEDLVPAGGDLAAIKELVARLASAGLVVTSRNAVTSSSPAPETPATVERGAIPESYPG
jgi:hypothetical protein